MSRVKRALVIVLALFMLAAAMPGPASAETGMSNFTQQRSYTNRFRDVSKSAWYYDSVAEAYSLGFIDGITPTAFEPDGELTYAQTLKLAACIAAAYLNEFPEFEGGDKWYTPYVLYCNAVGIDVEAAVGRYDEPVTRADFAYIMHFTLPEKEFAEINSIGADEIPDVSDSHERVDAIYLLYRAGVLTGSDEEGSFLPDKTIKRCEAATIIMRIAMPGQRRELSLTDEE